MECWKHCCILKAQDGESIRKMDDIKLTKLADCAGCGAKVGANDLKKINAVKFTFNNITVH